MPLFKRFLRDEATSADELPVRVPADRQNRALRTTPVLLKAPANGAEIAPDTVLTLPDGRQLPAQQYYDTLNQFEAAINQAGYTVRSEYRGEPPVVRETMVDEGLLRQQRERIESQFGASYRQNGGQLPPYHFRLSYGVKGVLGAEVFGETVIKPSPGSLTWTSELRATVNLLGGTTDLLSIGIEVVTPLEGSSLVSLKADIPGKNLVNVAQQELASHEDGREGKGKFSVPVRVPVRIGPFQVGLKATGIGEATASARYEAGAGRLKVLLNPSIKSRLELSGDVKVLIGGVRFESDVNLLNCSIDLHSDAAVAQRSNSTPENPQWYCQESTFTDSAVEMLRGQARAIVYVYVPRFSIPPWRRQEFALTIWRNNGVKKSGRLFESKNAFNLMTPPTPQ